MVQPQSLHLGDWVRTIAPLVQLPIGTQGVIRAIFPLGDFYGISFSEPIGLRIVHRTKLERLLPTQDSTTVGSM